MLFALVTFVFAPNSSALAYEDYWKITLQQLHPVSGVSPAELRLGTAPDASDGFDSYDRRYSDLDDYERAFNIDMTSGALVSDIRAPIGAGSSKRWQLRVSGGGFWYAEWLGIGVYLYDLPASIGGLPTVFTLRVLGTGHGLYPEPVVYTLGPNGMYPAQADDHALWLALPARYYAPHSSDWTNEVYYLDFQASAIPEPPSLLIIASGATMLLRRRQK